MLSERVANGSWNQRLPGDVLQLEGSNKWFLDDGSDDLSARVAQLDIHPTGLLAGDGQSQAQFEVKAFEEGICARYPQWTAGLQNMGLKADRRALRVKPLEMSWQWLMHDGQPSLKVSFGLRPGSYATMVLREILHATDVQAVTPSKPFQTTTTS